MDENGRRQTSDREVNDSYENEDRNLTPTGKDDSQSTAPYVYGTTGAPWDLMRRFSDDVDRIFASLGFGGRRRGPTWARPPQVSQGTSQGRSLARSGMGSAWSPAVDISTEGDDLVVCVDLPGLRPEDVEIETADNQLIVRGEYRNESDRTDEKKGYRYTERSYGSFYRSIPLPPGISAENAQADMNNGVLRVTVPGAARTLNPPRKRIPIGGAQQQRISEESLQGTAGQQPNFTDTNTDTATGSGTGSGQMSTNPDTYDQSSANPS